MRRFRNIWFALAAFLWLPAYAHCQLEALTGLEFLKCTEIVPDSHVPAKDCADCCAVEKSQFRTNHSRLAIPQPEPMTNFLAVRLIPDLAELLKVPLGETLVPPELPQRWRFLARTALPARAPSLVS